MARMQLCVFVYIWRVCACVCAADTTEEETGFLCLLAHANKAPSGGVLTPRCPPPPPPQTGQGACLAAGLITQAHWWRIQHPKMLTTSLLLH